MLLWLNFSAFYCFLLEQPGVLTKTKIKINWLISLGAMRLKNGKRPITSHRFREVL